MHELSNELKSALEQEGTICGPNYVLMDINVFRVTMGLETEDELRDSLAAIDASYQAANRGDRRLMSDALDDLGRKYET